MKTALIANRGIGLELTRQLLDSGYKVNATFRSNKGGLEEIEMGISESILDVRDSDF